MLSNILMFYYFAQLTHKEIYEEVKPNYIAIKNRNGKNIWEVHIYKTQLMIVTREPKNDDLKIGTKLPDNYLWTLNYKIYFNSEKDIDNVLNVLLDVYEQIKQCIVYKYQSYTLNYNLFRFYFMDIFTHVF